MFDNNSEQLIWNWYLTPVVNFGEVRRAQLAKSTLLTSKLVPLWSFLRSFKICSDAEESGVQKAMGSYRSYSIPGKTAASIPEFAVEDLPLGGTAALVPELSVKDLPLGRTLWWW